MKKISKLVILIFVVLLLITTALSGFTVNGETAADTDLPYESYTYWYGYSGNKKAVYSRPMYTVHKVLDSTDLGLSEKIVEITDICSAGGNIYILDGGASKIVVLDSNYNLKNVISQITDPDGNEYSFLKASGIYANGKDSIYIADTENKRVLVCDEGGVFKKTLTLPESKLIPDDFDYKPLKLSVDSRGYLYVLSDGSYYGAILYSPDGEFLGFYGANTVKGGVVTALKKIFDKLFSNDVKKSQSERALPYQFNDLFIDSADFVYTATGNTNLQYQSATQTGQIKRLSPGGTNILKSDDVDFADYGTGLESQDILGIEVDDRGFIFAIDSKYGHIFMYDSECTIMSVFGTGYGSGIQDGSFTALNSITVNGDDVIVSDKIQNTVSIFKITEYGSMVKSAQHLTVQGKYKETAKLWEEIMALDSNSQLAYMGLAKVYYDQGKYKKAMEFAKTGCDRETYANAFEKVRNTTLKKNFGWIIVGVAVITAGLVILIKYLRKKLGGRFIKNVKFKTFMSVTFHPADSYAAIKEKKLGSVLIGAVVLVLYYITSVMCVTNGGFAYTMFDPTQYNAMFTFLQTAGLVLLFTVTFWCVSTLFGGLGKIADIFVVVCYSIVPLLFGNILQIVLTNVLVPSELSFLTIVLTALKIYTAFLLCMGLIIINDFEFGRFLGVTVLAVIGIVIVLFLIIVVILLLQLLWGFIVTVFNEIIKLLN